MKHLTIPVRLNWNCLVLAVLLFLVELFIGFFMNDPYIRPYAGDFLVVIMLYYFAKAFLDFPALPVAMAVLLFSYFVEWTQYMHLADHLGLRQHSVIRVLIGDYFTWMDMACYTVGICSVLLMQYGSIAGCMLSEKPLGTDFLWICKKPWKISTKKQRGSC